jgi:hypothetical protein
VERIRPWCAPIRIGRPSRFYDAVNLSSIWDRVEPASFQAPRTTECSLSPSAEFVSPFDGVDIVDKNPLELLADWVIIVKSMILFSTLFPRASMDVDAVTHHVNRVAVSKRIRVHVLADDRAVPVGFLR